MSADKSSSELLMDRERKLQAASQKLREHGDAKERAAEAASLVMSLSPSRKNEARPPKQRP